MVVVLSKADIPSFFDWQFGSLIRRCDKSFEIITWKMKARGNYNGATFAIWSLIPEARTYGIVTSSARKGVLIRRDFNVRIMLDISSGSRACNFLHRIHANFPAPRLQRTHSRWNLCVGNSGVVGEHVASSGRLPGEQPSIYYVRNGSRYLSGYQPGALLVRGISRRWISGIWSQLFDQPELRYKVLQNVVALQLKLSEIQLWIW